MGNPVKNAMPQENHGEFPEQMSSPVTIPERNLMIQSIEAIYMEVERLRSAVEQQERQLKSMAVEMLLLGRWKPKEQINRMLGFSHAYYLIGNYDFREPHAVSTEHNPEMAVLKGRIFSLFQQCFAPQFPSYYCEPDFGINTLLLNSDYLTEDAEERLIACARQFLYRAEKELNQSLNLCLSSICGSVDQLPKQMKQIQRLWKLQHILPDHGGLLYGGRLETDVLQNGRSQSVIRRQMQLFLTERDIPAACREAAQLVLMEYASVSNIEHLTGFVRAELEQIQRALNLEKRGVEIMLSAKEQLKNSRTTDMLLIVLMDYFGDAARLLETMNREQADGEKNGREISEQVMNYIRENFADREIDVGAVAAQFHCSTGRISRQFQAAYGISILNCIHRMRVRRAKELLENKTDVQTAAELSGFGSRRSFDRVFRQFVGCTPVQYQKMKTE